MKYIFRPLILLLAIMLSACSGVGSLQPIIKDHSNYAPYSITEIEIIDNRKDVVDIQNIDTPNSFFRGNYMASALNSKLSDEIRGNVQALLMNEHNPNGVEVNLTVGVREARKTYYSYFWSEVEKVEVALDLKATGLSSDYLLETEGVCMMSEPTLNADTESINKKMLSAFDCAIHNALHNLYEEAKDIEGANNG
ncbi:MAG: hypothetical protein HWE18_08540 [Gammaproteobacteria bacterium]|nr:hypothetical protein [Gammaproteobacteria bacterium]